MRVFLKPTRLTHHTAGRNREKNGLSYGENGENKKNGENGEKRGEQEKKERGRIK